METSNLLTISEFAKLVNVHPKSLLYYEKLGLLRPAYTNPNGYRYYSLFQREMVWEIQFSIEAGISCKELSNLVKPHTRNDDNIQYDVLLEKSAQMVQERMEKLRQLSDIIGDLSVTMARCESRAHTTAPAPYSFPGRLCWRTPFDGEWGDVAFGRCLYQAGLKINELKLGPLDYFGLMVQKEQGSWRQYLFYILKGNGERPNRPELFWLPGGRLCLPSDCGARHPTSGGLGPAIYSGGEPGADRGGPSAPVPVFLY